MTSSGSPEELISKFKWSTVFMKVPGGVHKLFPKYTKLLSNRKPLEKRRVTAPDETRKLVQLGPVAERSRG